MKKLSVLFAAVTFSFTLGAAGCKKKEEKKDTPATTEPAKPADPAAKPAEGDKPADPAAATGDKPADPAAAAPAAGGGDLPAECNEYKEMIEKLATCEKLPQQSRDALKQGYDAMAQGWANIGSMPAEAKTAMADGCKKGTEALKQAAAATCGW